MNYCRIEPEKFFDVKYGTGGDIKSIFERKENLSRFTIM